MAFGFSQAGLTGRGVGNGAFTSGLVSAAVSTGDALPKHGRVSIPVMHSPPYYLPTGVELTANAIVDCIVPEMLCGRRILVGVVGGPGSGKTTTVSSVVDQLQKSGFRTEMLPMDGFHFYRHQLDEFDDPVEAHKRRGAPFTFDAKRFVSTLEKLRASDEVVYAPSFDHRKKDPTEKAIRMDPNVEIIVVEGNYLLLDKEPWKEVREILDGSFYLDVDLDVAMSRVARRHVDQIGLSEADAWHRVRTNDRPNAELIREHRRHADFIVRQNLVIPQQQNA